LPITDYKNRIEQAFNIASLYQEPRFSKTGKWLNRFSLTSKAEEQQVLKNTLEMLKNGK